jgi:hypothetical protein
LCGGNEHELSVGSARGRVNESEAEGTSGYSSMG